MDPITIAKAAGDIIEAVEAVPSLLRKVERSDRLQARFDEAVSQVNRDMNQVCFAVCRALIAHMLGRTPDDEEVTRELDRAIQNPAFPNRAYRLLGEARKSASRRRRVFLASVLFGPPLGRRSEDEQDRVDMAVERMTVEDVTFLMKISAKRKAMGPESTDAVRKVFGPSGVVAVIQGTVLRIATPEQWDGEASFEIFESPDFIEDRAPLASLMSVGCLDLGETVMNAGGLGTVHHLLVMPLGDMVLRAIEEVRPGLDA